jgi:hypothetical protein
MHRNVYMETFVIPLILFVFVIGGAIVGYYAKITYDIDAAYVILGYMAVIVVLLMALRTKM